MNAVTRLCFTFFFLALCLQGQEGRFAYPPQLPDAQAEVYKTVGGVELKLYIFNPPASTPQTPKPAIVFFFGGGWRNGSPMQFASQCRHLASLGMVAITADYRVSSRNHSTIADSDHDAASAIRYVRANAARLGIDPRRIAAGGGSAGGQLAAAAALVPNLDDPSDDTKISARPNALVLFNPALVLAGMAQLPVFQGVEPASVSPFDHIGKGAPPTVIFHGRADTTVPYATVEAFTAKMKVAGNQCELIGFDGQNHGFFNYSAAGNRYYDETVRGMDRFLASLGYLKATAGDSSAAK